MIKWQLNKKPTVFYGADKIKKEEIEAKEMVYDDNIVSSFMVIYNKKIKAYDLLTNTTNLDTMATTSEITKIRGADTKARAMFELQKVYTKYLIDKERKK